MAFLDRVRKLFGREKEYYIPGYSFSTNSMTEAPSMTNEEYMKVNERVATVYACVRLIANSVSEANWRLYDTSNDEWEEIYHHPVLSIFNNPVPFLTRYELFSIIVQQLELIGESTVLLLKNNKKEILGLTPINPILMKLNIGDNNMPENWSYMTVKGQITLPLEDILFFKYPSPRNIYRGLSPLRSIAETVDTDYFASQWNKNFFYNAATPRTALMVNGKLQEEQFKRLQDMLDTKYTGLKNSHKYIILENGLDVKHIDIPQKDMEFLELKKFAREEIASTFGVPLTKLGLNENSNKATAYVNDYTFAKNTLTPKLKMMKEVLNKYFISQFDENLQLDFDSVIPQDEEFEVNKYVQYVKSNILTINEVRAELGYDKVEWGDEPGTPIMFGVKNENIKKKQIDEEKINKYWQRLIAKRMSDESYFKGWVTRQFTKQEEHVLINLKDNLKSFKKGITRTEAEYMSEQILQFLLSDEEMEIWQGKHNEITSKLFVDASKDYAKDWGLLFAFDEPEGRMVWMLADKSQKFARQVNKTTYDKLKNQLIEGIFAGEGEKELAARVEDIMTLSRRQRSSTIARTEVFTTINHSHYETLRQNHIENKEWYAALDERTRPAHAEAHGQVVMIDEPFVVGGEMLEYPGDGNGSAGNIINCRCLVLPAKEG